MKTLLFAIALVLALLTNSPAMAQKVPTNLCLDFVGFSDNSLVGIKAGPTVKTNEGPIKQYVVQGNHSANSYSFPVSGSAYVIPATTVLHGYYSGSQSGGATLDAWSFEFFYDVVLEEGDLFVYIDRSNGTKSALTVSVFRFDCKIASFPLSIARNGEEPLNKP